MTEMPLAEAIAEVKGYAPDGLWIKEDFEMGTTDCAASTATILNAVASGDLIPRTDAELAVALAYQRAASRIDCGCMAGCRDETECPKDDVAAILALAPAEPLAEVARLREAIHDAYSHQLAACAEWEGEMAKARGAASHKVAAARYAGHYSAANDLAKRIAALAPQKDATP